MVCLKRQSYALILSASLLAATPALHWPGQAIGPAVAFATEPDRPWKEPPHAPGDKQAGSHDVRRDTKGTTLPGLRDFLRFLMARYRP